MIFWRNENNGWPLWLSRPLMAWILALLVVFPNTKHDTLLSGLVLASDSPKVEGERISPTAGSKVLIGLIDTGFDIHHPDLRHNGHSRIIKLWDQRDLSRHNGPDSMTAVYDGSELDTRYHLTDRDGHGTAVASIITADDRDGGDIEADLVCVCVPVGAGQTQVVAAIDFIWSVAESGDRPYVINLSAGFPGGAKDGETDSLEYGIARLFKTDTLGLLKQVVTAAGNSNYDSNSVDDLRTAHLSLKAAVTLENRRSHSRGHGPGMFNLNLTTTPNPADDSCVLELWYPASRPYTVSITAPNQTVVVAPEPGVIWAPDPSSVYNKFGFVEVSNRGPVQGPGIEPPRWSSTKITLRDDTAEYGPLMGGKWLVELASGFGTWDAYITAVGPSDCEKAIFRDQISNECLLEVGSNVPDAICVGSYNPCTMCEWKTIGGQSVTLDANLPGFKISHFSSRGPTREGVDKPDLYAPGECCVVALSADVPADYRREIDDAHLRTEDTLHYITEGTSYAAPRVTGLVAKMVALRPCLRPDEIKHILTSTADHIFDGPKLCYLVNADQALKITRKFDCH
jgi:subtilisin family serine protease